MKSNGKGEATYTDDAIARDVAVVRQSIQPGAGPALVTIGEVRRSEGMRTRD